MLTTGWDSSVNLDLFLFSVLFTSLEIAKSSQPEERFSFLRVTRFNVPLCGSQIFCYN